jgi:hypothetical protein
VSRTQWLQQAIADGHFSQEDRFMPGMNKHGRTAAPRSTAAMCSASIPLSEPQPVGRHGVWPQAGAGICRSFLPANTCRAASRSLELITTAPVMGVRDSRRIVGEFELGIEDFRANRRQFA